MKSVELFSGAGGLALGISQAGFRHEAVLELDHDACNTIRANQARKLEHVRDWKLEETDVKVFDFSRLENNIDLLAAGVPCQPWSIGGKHQGYEDLNSMTSFAGISPSMIFGFPWAKVFSSKLSLHCGIK